MKKNILSKNNFFNSRNSNIGHNNSSFNYSENSTNNVNDLTFKKNCNSIDKYIKINKELIKSDEKSEKYKSKNNKSSSEINNSLPPRYCDQGNSSALINEKKIVSVKTSESILKMVNNQNKTLYNNLLKKNETVSNKFNLKSNVFSNSLKKTHLNESVNFNKDELMYKPVQTDVGHDNLVQNMSNTNDKNILKMKKILNPNKKAQNASELYSDKIKDIKSVFNEIKNNQSIQNKDELIKDLQNTFNELIIVSKQENTLKNENEHLIDGQNQIKSSILDIEQKFDTLVKENEILKEMIKSKTNDFDQMKYLLINLTNKFDKFSNNNHNNNENLSPKAVKYLDKCPNQTYLESKIHNNKRSVSSSNADCKIIDGEKISSKINTDNYSSISICSEFSMENSKDFYIHPTNSNHSIKFNLKQV